MSPLTEAVFSLPENDRRGGVALAREFARRTTLDLRLSPATTRTS